MGKGIDLARSGAPLHAAVLDDFKDQLIVVLLKRLVRMRGLDDTITIPIAEMDDTGQDLVVMKVVDGVFYFMIQKKD